MTTELSGFFFLPLFLSLIFFLPKFSMEMCSRWESARRKTHTHTHSYTRWCTSSSQLLNSGVDLSLSARPQSERRESSSLLESLFGFISNAKKLLILHYHAHSLSFSLSRTHTHTHTHTHNRTRTLASVCRARACQYTKSAVEKISPLFFFSRSRPISLVSARTAAEWSMGECEGECRRPKCHARQMSANGVHTNARLGTQWKHFRLERKERERKEHWVVVHYLSIHALLRVQLAFYIR